MQHVFGSGQLFATPHGHDSGTTAPVQVAALRGVAVDMGFNPRSLHGGPWPLAVGRGTGKVECKAEYAQFTAAGLNAVYFGGAAPAVGMLRIAVDEPHTVAGGAIVPLHAGAFVADLGLTSALPSGSVLRRVAAAPGPGEYTCDEGAGAYAVGGGDGQAVLLNYSYADAAVGWRIDMASRTIGHTPRFSAVLTETFNGKAMTLVLNDCTAKALSLRSRTEDFMLPSFAFAAAADDAGKVGTLSIDEGAPLGQICSNENFTLGLGPYSLEFGNAWQFAVIDSPYGQALTNVPGTVFSTDNTRIRRSLTLRRAASVVSFKFYIDTTNTVTQHYMQLWAGTTLVATITALAAELDSNFSGSGKPEMSWGGVAAVLSSSPAAGDKWHQLDVSIVPGAGNSFATLTNLTDAVVISTVSLAGSFAPQTVNAISFSVNGGIAFPSITRYADIHVCEVG